jgi:opacity protein-like surface antigen
MKKRCFKQLVVVFCMVLLASYGNAEGILKNFSLRLSIGMGNTMGGDLKDVIDDMNTNLTRIASMAQVSLQGGLENVNWGPDFEGEILYKLSKNFAMGLGFVYMTRKKDSSIGLLIDEDNRISLTWEPEYSAFPINVSAYYFIPVNDKIQAYVKAGTGYYFAKMDFRVREEEHTYYYDDWNQDVATAKDKGFGFHGGFGIEYNLSNKISIFLEGTGKYVNFNNWDVKNTNTSKYYSPMEVEGTLWVVEEYDPDTDQYYTSLQLLDETPSGPYIRNPRKADISFSGISLRIGIKIRLGKK